MVKPTVISTFAGCGGSSLGYKWAGFHELLAVDFDPHAVETFKVNFDVSCWLEDVRNITGKQILDFCKIRKGDLGVLDGSPPCQGFSTAGKRKVTDVRNDLAWEFIRLIKELQPRAFVMENVSGMVKGGMRGVFNEILKQMKTTDYHVEVHKLNAMYYGIPQSRERIIFIGMRDGQKVKWPERQKVITVKEAIGDLGNEQDVNKDHVWIDESPEGRNTKTWHLANQAKQGEKYAGHHRRLRWRRPASTVTTGGLDGMPPYLRSIDCHPLYTRTFSVLEYKRIMGFPDRFVLLRPVLKRWNVLGNSVPPRMIQAIAGCVKEALNGQDH